MRRQRLAEGLDGGREDLRRLVAQPAINGADLPAYSSKGSAKFAAIRRTSSLVSSLAAERQHLLVSLPATEAGSRLL